MVQPFTVRNLTSTSLQLKIVERFNSPPNSKANFTAFISFCHPARPDVQQLEASSDSYHAQDVLVPIEPFKTVKTSILPAAPDSGITVRLTFECENQAYRISTPTPLDRSAVLTPLANRPNHEFTAVYLPEHSFLALYMSSDLHCWMKSLRDDTPLALLSIPGTHNSPTHYRAMPSVRCQAVSIKDQLQNGIRFFDVRVQPESAKDETKPTLYLVHSAFSVCLGPSKHLKDFLDDLEGFLDENSSETVLLSLKREGTGSATDEHLSRILKQHYADRSDKWFTEPRVPTLGEARKKIILIRRFKLHENLRGEWGGRGWGIDASVWADNTPCAPTANGEIFVQDFYEVLESQNIEKKISYVEEHMAKAAEQTFTPSDNMPLSRSTCPLYINFLNGSNFWKAECWPEKIAAKLNPATVDYLCRKHNGPDEGKKLGDGCTGAIVCDWVGNNGNWDLVRCVVGMNAKLEVRQKRSS
ncbi:MAG: hypothetical protein LQ340_003414 [Diploschistes diacapsis]|nr:MAG: hypothetical protein LQ340_003414 [Diploschistes diacapsis]